MKRITQGWYVVCLAALTTWSSGEVQAQLAANRGYDQHASSRRGPRATAPDPASALEAELTAFLEPEPSRPARRENGWDASPLKSHARVDSPVRNVDYKMYEGDVIYEDGDVYDEGFHGPASCSTGACDMGCGPGHMMGGWGKSFFIGGEYLLLRPHFSDSTAFIRNDASQNGSNFAFHEQSIDFDYDYESQFRGYMGFRLDQCQSEIRFTFWNMNFFTDAPSQAPVPAVPAGQTIPPITYVNNIDTAASDPGDIMTADSALDLNVYDVDFSKRVTFNKVPCNTGCCGPCFVPCPGWDMEFTLGVRVADIDREYRSTVYDVQGAQKSTGQIDAKFVGAGPRLGIQGRRFFGSTGCWYAYGKGSGALLVGNWERNITRFTADTGTTLLTTSNGGHTRTIPVTEIELGMAYQPNRWLNFSAGWLFQTWWDMGAYEAASASFIPLDDGNILSFDGLTIRGELTF